MKAARRDAILLSVLLLTVVFLVSCAPAPSPEAAATASPVPTRVPTLYRSQIDPTPCPTLPAPLLYSAAPTAEPTRRLRPRPVRRGSWVGNTPGGSPTKRF